MECVGSVSCVISSAGSVSLVPGLSTPVAPPLSFARVTTPKATALTAGDVRRLPCLKASLYVDVAAVLSQCCVVAGFKAKTVRPNDDDYSDALARGWLSLTCHGPVLTLY